MLMDSLAFRTARAHVHNLSSEYDELMVRHREATDCFDCEAFLQLGIDAFGWLTRADQSIRKDMFSGRLEYDEGVTAAAERLYKLWLRPCDDVEKWIAKQEACGYNVSNVEEFRRCVSEVKAIVRANTEVAGELAEIRDEAIEADARGESTDWAIEESTQSAI